MISLYYYFGIIRAIYWSKNPTDLSPIPISLPMKISLYACMAGMFYLGVFPNLAVNPASEASGSGGSKCHQQKACFGPPHPEDKQRSSGVTFVLGVG